MTYRVQYNGIDVEAATLESAIEYAKSIITDDAGPMTTWTVEHDEVVNDWFVQGIREDSPLEYTATVAGPEPVAPVEEASSGNHPWLADDAHRPGTWHPVAPPDDDRDERLRSRSFTGATPAEVFDKATAWLAGRHGSVGVIDLGWHHRPDSYEPLNLTIYYYPL